MGKVIEMGWQMDLAMRSENRRQLELLLGPTPDPTAWANILWDIKGRCKEIDRYTAKLERELTRQADVITRLRERVRIVERLNRRRR